MTTQEVDRFRRHKLREREVIEARAAAGAPVLEDRRIIRAGREIVWKQRKRPLSDAQINRLIDHLATLLDIAIERPDVRAHRQPRARAAAQVKVTRPAQRSYLEPEQVWALLDAAAALEREARRVIGTRAMPRRAILATLVMGGERISELCATAGATSTSTPASCVPAARPRPA